MIGLPPGTKVFLACQPIDLRAGFDGLACLVPAAPAWDYQDRTPLTGTRCAGRWSENAACLCRERIATA